MENCKVFSIDTLLALTTGLSVFSDPGSIRDLLIHMCGEEKLAEEGSRRARACCAAYLRKLCPELSSGNKSDLRTLCFALEIFDSFAQSSDMNKVVELICSHPSLKGSYEVPQLPNEEWIK